MLSIFSLVIFFIFFYIFNIITATIAISFYYLFFFIFFKKKNGVFLFELLFNFILFFVFGGISFVFNNDIFIKWKVSIVYWILSIVFLFFYFFKYSFISTHLKKHNINLNKVVSNYINIYLFLIFLNLGLLNLYVAYNFSTKIWVMFKVVGFPLIIFMFIFIFFFRHIDVKDD